jgi:hypothetical protein
MDNKHEIAKPKLTREQALEAALEAFAFAVFQNNIAAWPPGQFVLDANDMLHPDVNGIFQAAYEAAKEDQ